MGRSPPRCAPACPAARLPLTTSWEESAPTPPSPRTLLNPLKAGRHLAEEVAFAKYLVELVRRAPVTRQLLQSQRHLPHHSQPALRSQHHRHLPTNVRASVTGEKPPPPDSAAVGVLSSRRT